MLGKGFLGSEKAQSSGPEVIPQQPAEHPLFSRRAVAFHKLRKNNPHSLAQGAQGLPRAGAGFAFAFAGIDKDHAASGKPVGLGDVLLLSLLLPPFQGRRVFSPAFLAEP